MQKTMQSYQEMMMQKQMAELNKIAEPNRKAAEAFLAKNKEKDIKLICIFIFL